MEFVILQYLKFRIRLPVRGSTYPPPHDRPSRQSLPFNPQHYRHERDIAINHIVHEKQPELHLFDEVSFVALVAIFRRGPRRGNTLLTVTARLYEGLTRNASLCWTRNPSLSHRHSNPQCLPYGRTVMILVTFFVLPFRLGTLTLTINYSCASPELFHR